MVSRKASLKAELFASLFLLAIFSFPGFSGCNEGSIKSRRHKKGTNHQFVVTFFFLPFRFLVFLVTPETILGIQLHKYRCFQCFLIYLLSFSSDSSLTKVSPCSEAGKPCNPCLDAAKACNLNETCKRLRSAYNSICSKAVPPQSSLANQEPCSRKRCQKVGARWNHFQKTSLSPLCFS